VIINKDGVIVGLDETANPGVARDQAKLRETAAQAAS
jgi:hypothetical protein